MSTVFGNTVVSRYPDGGWVKHWFNPDGTYAAQFSDGRRLAARWAVAGEQVCLFSSDYPHVEGGRNPLKRFDESLTGLSCTAIDRFYTENFIDLMGEGLAHELRRPAHLRAA
jgi:hypothetical protein